MNKYIFILLSTLLSGLASGSISAILAYFYTLKYPEHPHQIIPTWMIMLFLCFILGAVTALIWTLFLIFYQKETNYSLGKTVLATSAVGLGMMGLLILFF